MKTARETVENLYILYDMLHLSLVFFFSFTKSTLNPAYAMGWHPVQGLPCLLPEIIQDWVQHPSRWISGIENNMLTDRPVLFLDGLVPEMHYMAKTFLII